MDELATGERVQGLKRAVVEETPTSAQTMTAGSYAATG